MAGIALLSWIHLFVITNIWNFYHTIKRIRITYLCIQNVSCILPSADNNNINPNSPFSIHEIELEITDATSNMSADDWINLFTTPSINDTLTDEKLQDLRNQFLPCRLEKNFIPMYNVSLGNDSCYTLNSVCRRPIRVIYTDSPPLIFADKSGTVKGILKEYLNEVLVERCCLSCNSLEFVSETTYYGKFFNYGHDQNADILIPIEFRGKEPVMFGHTAVSTFRHKSVYYLGFKAHVDTLRLVRELIGSALGTWPLFVIALSMSMSAGIVIWISEQWNSDEQFPKSFPKGAFEGFWWAYVSMTTVGYGDKTPVSIIGRLFAILWILVGITLFNMFTATIVNSMNKAIQNQVVPFTIKGKAVGHMNHKPHVRNNIINLLGHPTGYHLFRMLLGDLVSRKIEVLALDELTYFFYLTDIETVEGIEIKEVQQLSDYNVGFAVMERTSFYKIMQNEFNENNQEDLDFTKNLLGRETSIKTYQDPSISIMFNEEEEPFWLTMVMVFVFGVFLITVTLILRKCLLLKKQKNTVCSEVDAIKVEAGGDGGGGGNVIVVATK